MNAALEPQAMATQDRWIADVIRRERGRLGTFIRRRVGDLSDAEDILQEVLYELVAAYRLMQPIDQVTAWLYRVARNRITDLFRRREREARRAAPDRAEADDATSPLDLLPSPDAGPEAAYARRLLVEVLDQALDELPEEQRDVFLAHEVMGIPFKELARRTGVGVNTLLSRKHYAVLHLRRRLRDVYEELEHKGE